jgi:hypothetical protein
VNELPNIDTADDHTQNYIYQTLLYALYSFRQVTRSIVQKLSHFHGCVGDQRGYIASLELTLSDPGGGVEQTAPNWLSLER